MTHLTNQEIDCSFTPLLPPHFGGIWEGAVKSFRHHLVRVVDKELMTFEELNTLIIKVKAILNSRSLVPVSADPKDIQVLTPGHFLFGTTLTAPPAQDLSNERPSLLPRWQLVEKMKQDFWTRWHKEYSNDLNIRKKWTAGTHEIQIGSIVYPTNAVETGTRN
ncbi:uncharacterized protein LOC117182914 [Belonocnema kinseyi]|uniref:uncharacterized protein LOC117182914 n=1 Tax=Belonocnema kinseyi TaxID=2817044 RepID=UPI00143E0AD7|nr:uncharacterized protein LOC117182914 [Belonocnema kinseyi]